MVIFWLVLLGGLPTFSLGLLVWVVGHHLLTAEIPSAFSHKVKFRFLHCMLLYVIALVSEDPRPHTG
jgi:arylacetamide deacetylase-like 3/4